MSDDLTKVTIPITIELEPFGEFRLEPLPRMSDAQEFAVTFKFWKQIVISDLVGVFAKDLRGHVKSECMTLLEEVAKGEDK